MKATKCPRTVGMQCAKHVHKLCSLPNLLAHVVWGVRVTGARRKASCLTDLHMRVNGFLQMGLCSSCPGKWYAWVIAILGSLGTLGFSLDTCAVFKNSCANSHTMVSLTDSENRKPWVLFMARHTLGSRNGSRPLHPSHSFVDARESSGSLELSDLWVLLPWSQLKMFGVSCSQLPTASQSLARADLQVSRSTHDFPSGHSICQIFRRRLECLAHPT